MVAAIMQIDCLGRHLWHAAALRPGKAVGVSGTGDDIAEASSADFFWRRTPLLHKRTRRQCFGLATADVVEMCRINRDPKTNEGSDVAWVGGRAMGSDVGVGVGRKIESEKRRIAAIQIGGLAGPPCACACVG